MKPFWLLLVGVVLGWSASGVDWSRQAVAQESTDADSADVTTAVTEGTISAPPQKGMADWLDTTQNSDGVNRYQISAWGSTGGNGCYVIDSVTGRVWHAVNGSKPKLVVDNLTQK